ncbi:MAG: ABC transporter permease, partial [Bacilli bacterium]
MKILNELTIKNLKLNKKRTIVTIIGIILSTALMVGIGLLFSTFQDYMIREVEAYNGRYMAKYENVSYDNIKMIDNIDGVNYFYEKGLGFSKINSKNEYKPYLYINAVNESYFEELKLMEGSLPKSSDEIVISSHISSNGGVTYKVGDSITLDYGYRDIDGEKIYDNSEYNTDEKLVITDTKTFKIVGIVERSNYENYSASGYSVFTLDDNEKSADVYVIFDKKRNIIKQAENLANKIDYDKNFINYNSSLIALYGDSTYSNIMNSMIGMLIIMLLLVSIGCTIVIYNSFAISVMERKREFGLLSSIGATRKQLSLMIFYEAIIVGIIGIILGIVGAYIGIGTVVMILNKLLEGALEYKLELVTMPMFIIIPVIFMIVVILLSAIIPAQKAAKVSPIEAIRQNDDIKINKKKIKTRKFISKLFGVEGDIALKNIKRNKKKYRVTTISLFISIVLFISFSAYMNYTLNATDDMIGDFSYDIMVSVYGNNEEVINKLDEVTSSSEVEEYTKYGLINIPIVREVKYTDTYLKYNKNRFDEMYDKNFANKDYDYINVIVLDDDSYNKYKEEIGLKEDKVILLNKFKGVTYNDNKRVNYDANVIEDKKVTLVLCDFAELDDSVEEVKDIKKYCNKNLNNIFITDKNYHLTDEIVYNDSYKLIMNKRIFDAVIKEEIDYYNVNIVSDNYTNIDKILSELDKTEGVYYNNIKENTKMEKNIIL